MWSAANGDDNWRFLADLRALRDKAALAWDELAARAHYPSDVLKEAESGPALPTLPILAAYVRACDADVPEWEERWRRLGFDSNADPGLPIRPPGASPAAVAGARAGVSVAPPEAYDAERIRAVLRGAHGSSAGGSRGIPGRRRAASAAAERDTQGMAIAEPRVAEGPAGWSPGTSWEETTRWDSGSGAETGGRVETGGRDGDTATGWATDAGEQVQREGFQRDAFQGDEGPTTSWDGFQSANGSRWDGAVTDVPAGASWDGAATEVAPGTGWDTGASGLSGASANGNHHLAEVGDPSADTAVFEAPDIARAEAIRRDPFSTDWLQHSELTLPPDLEPRWQDQAEGAPQAPENWFTPRETTEPEQAWSSAEIQPSPAVADAWFTPPEPSEDARPELKAAPPESVAPVAGFWTPSTGAQAPELASPTSPASLASSASLASLTSVAETAAGDTQATAVRVTATSVDSPVTMPSRGTAGSAMAPGPAVASPDERRSDRLYPVRLLVVIVAVALIGSVLVLLLR